MNNDDRSNNDNKNDFSGGSYTFESADKTIFNGEPPLPRTFVKKKRRFTALKIISLCLACLILGTAFGVTTFDLWQGFSNTSIVPLESATPEPTPEPTSIANSGSLINTPNVEPGYTGAVLSASEVYATTVNSVVGITTPITTTNVWGQTITNAISGSGFVISEDGYILTNNHVVETAYQQNLEVKVMLYNGEEYSAKIIGTEPDNDVALIKIDATGLTPVVLGTLDEMFVGDAIYVIGNPLGELTWTLTEGIVSAFDREVRADDSTTINMFQISAAINAGNSGGPVFNDRGQVIGIASAKYSSSGVEGLGFAIPIDDVKPMIEDFIEYGHVTGKPYFGITVRTVDSASAEYYNMVEGAYIQAVDENSCAGTAGINVGDIITKIDEHEIKSTADLKTAKKLYSAGDTASLTIYRSGEYIELSITFDEEGAPRLPASVQG